MDPIADFIVKLKNASDVGKESIIVSYSELKEAILGLLEKEGYIKSFAKKGKKVHKTLEIVLAYDEHGPRVKGVERVSHLSKRVYAGVRDLKPVKQGHGVMVITTPNGIMTDAEARKQKVGGELLFKIW
jgi:small subunit ribosomal protein S8